MVTATRGKPTISAHEARCQSVAWATIFGEEPVERNRVNMMRFARMGDDLYGVFEGVRSWLSGGRGTHGARVDAATTQMQVALNRPNWNLDLLSTRSDAITWTSIACDIMENDLISKGYLGDNNPGWK